MFENYVSAKSTKRRTWVTVLLSVSFVAHAVAVVALIVHGFWVLEKLTPPKRQLAMAIAPPPKPPPPPPKPSPRVKVEPPPDKVVVKKVRPTDMTQPVEVKDDPDVHVVITDGGDSEFGEDIGQGDSPLDGLDLGIKVDPRLQEAPKVEAPKVEPPKTVRPSMIDAQRVSGNRNIAPDESIKIQIQRDGNSRIVTSVKMCISRTGAVTKVRVVKPSGYPAYDRKIEREMRQWRYSPFMVDGKASPVCSSVTFVYVQH